MKAYQKSVLSFFCGVFVLSVFTACGDSSVQAPQQEVSASTETQGPPPPTQLALSGSSSILVGGCNGYSVTTKDTAGVDSPVASDLTVSLSGKGSGSFFSDPSCALPLGSDQLTIGTGTFSQSFSYKNSNAESVTLQASANGLTPSTLPVTIAVNTGPIGGLVELEAENFANSVQGTVATYVLTWQQASSLPGASGGIYMIVPSPPSANAGDTTNGPRMDYDIDFSTAGTYYVWVRMWGSGDSTDSIHAGLLASGPATYNQNGMTDRSNNWHWEERASTASTTGQIVTINIPSTGIHTFSIWMRESGTAVDKITLTTDPAYVPDSVVASRLAFQSTLHPVLINGCGGCHHGFASSDLAIAHEQASSRVDFVNKQWRPKVHNCQTGANSTCLNDINTGIQNWIGLLP